MERAEQVDEAFRRLEAGEPAVQPATPSVAEGVGRLSGARLHVRGWIETALQRLQSSDLALGVHAATSSGGGRIGALAALIGICASGVGAGTYCVATALLPERKAALRAEEARPATKRHEAARAARIKQLSTPVSHVATPVPTPPPRPARSARRRTNSTPRTHEQPPISPARASTQDFSIEQTAADSGPASPAAAPATGGSEFEP
jgi:hypothetical protein